MREGVTLVVVAIHLVELIQCQVAFNNGADENAAREVAAPGHEVYLLLGTGLQYAKRASDLSHVLMCKCFIRRHIVCTPGEVGGVLKFLSSAGRSCYTGGIYFIEFFRLSKWKQAELNGRCETPGICDVARFLNLLALELRQSINKLTITGL